MAEPAFVFDTRVQPICQIGASKQRQAEPTSWFDVSCYVHEAELFRGRERFNERFEPGTASVTFDNRSGWADFAGDYDQVAGADLRPGRQIRIGVKGPWSKGVAPFVRWLYRGFIDQALTVYDPVLQDVITVNCIDALGEAGQATTPQGDFQGVNETAAQRINRVLDAVGWWGSKRKIVGSPTHLQGTALGSSAIDHMGQAADSAGGVVFGDLDGDVVFKDIDWMLYDPDVPPDDEIGNEPGEPGPPPDDEPPYIDPTPGPVRDPDDPPAVHPPKVCICADGSAGTLIEKGDNYRLYVKDGHLFYESGGHTWDLGPYTGGCTCVSPPGSDPDNPDGPPEREDDPDGDGVYEPHPDPAEPMPPQFAVELLAWNDGGLADPPTPAVIVSGVTPGHDCLLAVFINALGTADNTAGLAPVVTGAGLDWAHNRNADQAGDGASSFIFLAPVGRDDPGTFSVVVTWAAPSTSRSHIVTVWKVTAAVNDYLERFDAGAVLYATTDSDPPDEIEPGDGVQIVELAADRSPAGVATPTRLVDITIAQSLAEEGTEPFGAILADGDGPWIYPPNAPPQPAPTLLVGEWIDDFERADGPLGSDWVLGPGPGWADNVHPLVIEDGAAVETVLNASGSPYDANAMHWHEAQGPNQVIEIEIQPVGYCYLFTQANDTDRACQFVDFQFDVVGLVIITVLHFDADGLDSAGESAEVGYVGIPTRLRLESDADGTQRVYVNDELGLTWVDPDPVSGSYVGMGTERPSGALQPRILRAGGASLGAVRKTSWVAAWRVGAASHTVTLEDVNVGPSDIQSAQACLVLESAEAEAGWRLLGHALAAELTGVTAGGSLSFDNPPRPGSLVVVMVGVTHVADVIDSVSVTGADFTRVHVIHNSTSWGQGAIFTAVAPLDLIDGSWNVQVNHPAVESISAVVYEVAAPDETAPVGAVAAGLLGTGAAGSVDGSSSITLSAATDADSVVLAHLHVSAVPDPGNGAATVDGDEWHEEYQSTGGQRGYFQTMSRAPGQPESTFTDVHWDDVQTGDADAFSGVQLAVEIKPGVPLTGAGAGVSLGGETDMWDGTIDSAGAYDPITGEPIWTFP